MFSFRPRNQTGLLHPLRVLQESAADSSLAYVPSIWRSISAALLLPLHPLHSSQILYFIFPVPLMTQMCWETEQDRKMSGRYASVSVATIQWWPGLLLWQLSDHHVQQENLQPASMWKAGR